MVRSRFMIAFLFGLLLITGASYGQDGNWKSASVQVKDNGDGTFEMRMDGKEYLAITPEMAKNAMKTKVDLQSAQEELEAKKRVLENYRKVREHYDLTFQQQTEYVAELKATLDRYRELVRTYKQMKEPWLTVEGGIGATGGDTDPAVMIGLGIRAFKVWGFLQEKNSGALVGVSMPLF